MRNVLTKTKANYFSFFQMATIIHSTLNHSFDLKVRQKVM